MGHEIRLIESGAYAMPGLVFEYKRPTFSLFAESGE
jgi:hypothetical protein